MKIFSGYSTHTFTHAVGTYMYTPVWMEHNCLLYKMLLVLPTILNQAKLKKLKRSDSKEAFGLPPHD